MNQFQLPTPPARWLQNAHATPKHLAQSSPCGVLLAALLAPPPAPAAEPAFPSDMLSSVSSLFGVMHCDASLSMPTSWIMPCGCSAGGASRSAPVCSVPMLPFLLASPPPSSLSDRYRSGHTHARQPPARQHGNPTPPGYSAVPVLRGLPSDGGGSPWPPCRVKPLHQIRTGTPRAHRGRTARDCTHGRAER